MQHKINEQNKLYYVGALCILITVIIFGFSACSNKTSEGNHSSMQNDISDVSTSSAQQSPSNESISQSSQNTDDQDESTQSVKKNIDTQKESSNDLKSYIGKTYNQLKNEYPKSKIEDKEFSDFMNAAFPYLGSSNAEYNFVFYGTQAGPELSDVAKYYGDEIRCIGITGKAGSLFPEMEKGLSFKEFISSIGVKKYDYNDYTDGPGFGELSFRYEGFDIIIKTNGEENTRVKRSDPVLITRGDTTINDKFLEKTYNKITK